MKSLTQALLAVATVALAMLSTHAAGASPDFDGDGRSDILWRNAATGENYTYLMAGLSIAKEGYLRTVADPAWQVAGAGDFNGDGKSDILWRTLAWDASPAPGVSGYRIYYGTLAGSYIQSPGNGLSVGTVTAYTVNGLTRGTRYFFAVTAVDASNNESSYSNEVFKDIP